MITIADRMPKTKMLRAVIPSILFSSLPSPIATILR